MSSQKNSIGRRLISWIAATWRSATSWMHFRRNRRERLEQQAVLLEGMLQTMLMAQMQLASQLEEHLEAQHRQQLMEMAQPIAAALTRQDEMRAQEMETLLQVQTRGQQQTLELLTEILDSLQPPVEQQLFPEPGQLNLPQSSPS